MSIVSSLEQALKSAVEKLKRHRSMSGFPHIAEAHDVLWQTTTDGVWTGGFWVGLLWMAFYETSDRAFYDCAHERLKTLAQSVRRVPNHDLGMMFCPSAVTAWQLTGNVQFHTLATTAAETLASQFNQKARMIPGWGFFGEQDWRNKALVDTLMNLPLILWDNRADMVDIAIAHTRQSCAHHIRSDGSTTHLVEFDPESGDIASQGTYQGLNADSCWSRGQAWAMAGLSAIAAHIPDKRLMSCATHVSEYFWDRSQGNVPSWDFMDPKGPRDAAAASIASYAFFRLADLTREAQWYQRGRALLESLALHYLADDEHPYILARQTADLPHGLGIEGGTVYGDYFFMRALQLALGHAFPECF